MGKTLYREIRAFGSFYLHQLFRRGLTEIKKIDNQLKSIIGKYNFIINNVNFDDELLLNKENILKPKDFINSLSEIEILLIGEQHFINEQEQFLINFYDEILKKGFNTICLEVPEKNQINLKLSSLFYIFVFPQ